MKNVLYYITDHGLGHASRSVAIIRELEKLNVQVIIRNSNSKTFLKKSLPKIKIVDKISDVGTQVKKDGISVDLMKSKKSINYWIDNMDLTIKKEQAIIKKYNPNLIISDISAPPFKAAKLMGIPSIAISNFCWSDVLNILDSERISKIVSCYEVADLAIQLPFGTEMKPFRSKRKVGIVCKKPTATKKEILKKLRIKENAYNIFVNLNKEHNIYLKNKSAVNVLSTGASVFPNCRKIKPWIEGQNLCYAANLVICKLGYGMVSECITNGTPFVYLSDPKHEEQQNIEKQLKMLKLNNKITIQDLKCLDLDKLFEKNIRPKKQKNNTKLVTKIISEFF